MGIGFNNKEHVIELIDLHMSNVRDLISCIDFTQEDFKKQLQQEYRYFGDVKIKFQKDVPVPDTTIMILENKLEHYKKTNKYRYNIAEKIISYNNYLIGSKEDVPF